MPYPTLCPKELLGWFDVAERDLPWRKPETTPWHILISEVMLQQTPVSRVEPIWREWVERWPVPSAMAKTSMAEVLRAWGKLGYPRRAMRLHECATLLADDHDDQVPGDVETLLTLPGIGAYTARAIACFGFGQPVPLVDTNVRRVIARVVHGVAGSSPSARDLNDAEALLPATNGARFAAALMELGALICTARAPQCTICPLSSCAWRQAGQPPLDSPVRPAQKYAGTDRQVRGRLLDLLRGSSIAVTRAQLDLVWLTDIAQRDRALGSLLADGLVEQTADGRFALAGEGGEPAATVNI